MPMVEQAREVQQYDGGTNGCAKQKLNHTDRNYYNYYNLFVIQIVGV